MTHAPLFSTGTALTIEHVKSQAKKNFIINCVTALENFIKYWFLALFRQELSLQEELEDYESTLLHWEGIWELIEKKKELLVDEVTEGEITVIKNPGPFIISTYSFQKLNHIDRVMTNITGRNFFEKVENMEIEFFHSQGSLFIKI